MMLILVVFVLVKASTGDSEHICDRGCIIKMEHSTYPCSVMERNETDCNFDSYFVQNLLKFNVNGKEFFNFTLNSNQKENIESSQKTLDFNFHENNDTKGCYRVTFPSVPLLNIQQQEIEVHCIKGNNHRDIDSQSKIDNNITNKKTMYEEFQFNSKERILRIPKICKLRGQTCRETIRSLSGNLEIVFPPPTCEDRYLSIPKNENVISYKSDCDNEQKLLKISELEPFSTTVSVPCVDEFPTLFKVVLKELEAAKNKIYFLFSTRICSNFIVELFQGCPHSMKIINRTTLHLDTNFRYSYVFTNVTPGNYCIQVTALHDSPSVFPSQTIYTTLKSVSSLEVIESNDNVFEKNQLTYIILFPSVAVLLLALIAILYIYHNRRRGRELYIDETEEDRLLHIGKTMKNFKRNASHKILLLRCNEDEKTNIDIQNLISFLENCCYCEVLHSKTISAHSSMSETGCPIDWLSDVLRIATMTIVIVTNKAFKFYYPENFKNKPDPYSCLFDDNTFVVGIKILRNNENLKRLFARFCYTEDIPLNEFDNDIIEIPQALIHLFHSIHNQTSLLCNEEDLISYWMQDESFRYLFNLQNESCPSNSFLDNPVFEYPNPFLNNEAPDSLETANNSHALEIL